MELLELHITDSWLYKRRYYAFIILVMVIFLLIVLRLWYLQIWMGDYYLEISESNFIRTQRILPPRGLILDRNGKTLAENNPSFQLNFVPYLFNKNAPANLAFLKKTISLTPAEEKRITAYLPKGAKKRFNPILLRKDLPWKEIAQIESNKYQLSGLYIQAVSHRHYPYHEYAAHVVGFMNEINKEELTKLNSEGYALGDYIGRMGVESTYENYLRGLPGFEKNVLEGVSKLRNKKLNLTDISKLRKKIEPVSGKNIYLTLDIDFQKMIFEAAANHKSVGIVAIEPDTGRILGLVSKPGFDPNQWTGKLTHREKQISDMNPYNPMLNKAIRAYFPGSIYKIVTLLAALSEGVVTPETQIFCPGHFEYGRRVFRCVKNIGHGQLSLLQALTYSCDVYFWKIGEKLGIEKLAQYGISLGLGKTTQSGLPGEHLGLVPTKAWHRKHSREGFQPGFTINTAVGQGDTLVTPIQMAVAYAAIANGGVLLMPQLIEKIVGPDQQVYQTFKPQVVRYLKIPQHYLEVINEGLTRVVNDPNGTAYIAKVPNVLIAGKTGTAQVKVMKQRRQNFLELKFTDRDHAWFIGYGPSKNPKIVVAVFVEHGGFGGQTAAPIATQIITKYLEKRYPVVEEGKRVKHFDKITN